MIFQGISWFRKINLILIFFVFLIDIFVPFSSAFPFGGVTPKTNEGLGLLIGTLWCENKGFGYLSNLLNTEWL